MRLTWKRAALALSALVALGVLVVISGIVPVKASAGHWAVTRWFLDFAMARSVSTHSTGIDVPDLDDPSLVLQGAAHYEIGCSPCHARPGRDRSEILIATTPQPPRLVETLHLWSPAELFYIVRHGVKLTAMPAWPVTGRDDEVWAMVAFLRLLPRLDEEAYRRLAFRDGESHEGRAVLELADAPQMPASSARASARELLDVCARCHGREGRGGGFGAFPSLAGQRSAYLSNALLAFARGERRSGTMHVVAGGLGPATIATLAEHFSRRGASEAVLNTTEADTVGLGALGLVPRGLPSLLGLPPEASEGGAVRPGSAESIVSPDRGERIARAGLPDLKVPSCVACHGPSEHAHNASYPILAGQYGRYLLQQLRLFRSGDRGGTEFVELMHVAVRRLAAAEMVDLAAYYSSLGASR